MNQHLRAFLAYWHPRLSAWEDAGHAEADWAELQACRDALEEVRQGVAIENRRLLQLIA